MRRVSPMPSGPAARTEAGVLAVGVFRAKRHRGLPTFGCIARRPMNVEVNRDDVGLPQGAVQPLPAEARGMTWKRA